VGELGGKGTSACRIGVWGVFDGDAFGDALVPHVLRREFAARIPGAEIRVAAPYGSLRPTPRDGGEPAEPLGRWSPDRAAALASDLDCIVVVDVELLPDHDRLAGIYGVDRAAVDELDPGRWFVEGPGPEAEGRCPVIFQGVTVGGSFGVDIGPADAERLRAATAHRARFDADPVVLAPRLFSPDLLAKRLDYLWLMGWYPSEGAAVVIAGDASLLPLVPALAADLGSFLAAEPDLTVVLAELGSPGDTEFAAVLAAELPAESVYRLPRCAGLEDIAAAIASCAAFAGSSARAGLVALAYGRHPITLDAANPPEQGVFESALKAGPATGEGSIVTARADAELDLIAGIARDAAAAHRSQQTSREAPMPDTEQLGEMREVLDHLRVAHEARSRRLATERMVFANHLHKAENEIGRLKDEAARLREELSQATSRVARAEEALRAEAASRMAVEGELAALRATRTFRYTAELRTVYGRLRRIGDAPEVAPGP